MVIKFTVTQTNLHLFFASDQLFYYYHVTPAHVIHYDYYAIHYYYYQVTPRL